MRKIDVEIMKKNTILLLALIVITTVNAWSQDTIRVLAVGNSFSRDAVENNLYELGQEEGVTFIIGNLYIGGCSLERHWENMQTNMSAYSYRKINSSGEKIITPDISLVQGITDEEWDYISFQQNSPNSGFYETYFPYLSQLTEFTKKHATNPRVKLVLHQTWAYANDASKKEFARYNKDQKIMYDSIIKASRNAANEAGIKMIIPSGTAIQNGRSSFIGDNFCKDGFHLSLDLGRYTAACTWFESLTAKSVIGNPFALSTITPLELLTVQRAAHEAVLKPFEITTIRIEDNKVYSELIDRKSELNWMLSVLPRDRTSNGRLSFLYETFQDWLNKTGELPPDFDKMPSIPFLPNPLIMDEGNSNTPVTSMGQWEMQRDWMREQLERYITGTVPPPPENLQAKVLEERMDGEVAIQVVELSFGPDQKATLTLELMIPPGEGPFPVFLTNWSHREWAQIAVRRGYIGCLYAGADIKDDTEAYSEIWADQFDFTRLMRRAYGASRAVDYLYMLPYVDKKKIGITGHSRNGKTSLMAAAFDERIGACIPSSGGTGAEVPWRYNAHKYDVEDIALLACAQPAWLHPRLRFFIGREHKLPVDQNSFMSLIAPRGLMLSTAVTESASNIFGIEQGFHSVKKVYQFLNADDNVAITSRSGLHGVNAGDIERYIDFFDFVFERTERKPENRLFYNYSFEEWSELSDQHVNPLDNGQTLIDLNTYMSNSDKWERGKQSIIENLNWMLGDEPDGVTNQGPGQLDKGGIGERRFGSFLTRPRETESMKVMAITPYSGFGDNLFGYLYYPADESGLPVNKNLPVVIYLHEYDYSKGFSSMSYDHEIQSVFENITKLGYGVFAFDMIGFGNRLEEGYHFYDRYPQWSKMGKMVADTRSAVDALSNLDFVDSSKIIVSGYSLGGTVALLSAALDERIAGVVSIAGFTPMRTNSLERGTEGVKAYSHLHGLIPKLGFFVGHEKQIPVDFDEIIATIAPRAALLIAPVRDKDAHPGDIRNCVERVEKVYELYNTSQDNIQLYTPDDYNRFSTIMRRKMYDWLENFPSSSALLEEEGTSSNRLLAEDASWCWFSDPRAVYHNGQREAVYLGFINSKGDVKIKSHDVSTGENSEFTLHEALQVDDHNVPSLILLPDHKLLAFYCQHNGNIFMRKSKKAEDISQWEDEVILLKGDKEKRYCYVNPVMLSDENNRIYLFGRNIVRNKNGTYSDTRTYCIYSDDFGETWSDEINILDNLGMNSRPYVKYTSDNKSRIDFLFTNGHPGQGDDVSVYHMYYKEGAFWQTNGDHIASFNIDSPVGINKVNKVYDADSTLIRAWVWDIALDKNNRPVVTYTRYPAFTDHQYYYAKWDGRGWQTRKIDDAGSYITKIKPGKKLLEPHYSGGIVMDPHDPDIVYLSKQINGKFEIEKRILKENSTQIIESVTSNSQNDNIRPYVVVDNKKGVSMLMWMEGNYYHYTDFDTDLKIRIIQNR